MGHTEVIQLLLGRSEIDIEADDRTPLLMSSDGRKPEAYKLLVKH